MKNVFELMFRWCLTYGAVYILAAFPIISIVAAFAYIFNIAALHYCVLYPTISLQEQGLPKDKSSSVTVRDDRFNQMTQLKAQLQQILLGQQQLRHLNLNLNSLLVKRQIDNPSPGAVTRGN